MSHPRTVRSTPFTKGIAAELADARRARGLSQEAVANAIGTTATHVCAYERGRNAMNLSTLEKFCAVLGLRVRLAPADSTPSEAAA